MRLLTGIRTTTVERLRPESSLGGGVGCGSPPVTWASAADATVVSSMTGSVPSTATDHIVKQLSGSCIQAWSNSAGATPRIRKYSSSTPIGIA